MPGKAEAKKKDAKLRRELRRIISDYAERVQRELNLPEKEARQITEHLVRETLLEKQADQNLFNLLIKDLERASDNFNAPAIIPFAAAMARRKGWLLKKLKDYLQKNHPNYWKNITVLRTTRDRLIIEM